MSYGTVLMLICVFVRTRLCERNKETNTCQKGHVFHSQYKSQLLYCFEQTNFTHSPH